MFLPQVTDSLLDSLFGSFISPGFYKDQNTSGSSSGHIYRPQYARNCRLGMVGEHLLQDWYQSQHGRVWAEHRVLGKLFVNRLKLVPEQQALVDIGMRLD